MIDEFCDHHFALNQISEARQYHQRLCLHRFERWLGRSVQSATPPDLERWMAELVSGGEHVNTVRWRLNMLKPFFSWAWNNGHISADEFLRLRQVGPPRGASGISKPRPYKRKELDRFWTELADRYPLSSDRLLRRWQNGTSRYSRMWKHGQRLQVETVVSFALVMGLRANEIYTLTLDNMHPDNAFVVVQGKREDHREKLRDVAYAEPVRKTVIEWFRFRRLMAPTHNSPWLALSFNFGDGVGKPLPYDSYRRIVQWGSGWELHRFRHTCATERLRAGMPIEHLQRMLGHATIQQTLMYAELVRDDIAQSMNQTDDVFMRAVGRRKEAA